jgi:DNA polymerase III delta subunit
LKFTELKQSLKNFIAPCYVVEGEDAFLMYQSESLIKTRVVKSLGELNITYLDKYTSTDKLIDAFNTYPFMSEYKVAVVNNYAAPPEVSDAQRRAISEYFKNPNLSTVVVFVNDKKNDFLKKLTEAYTDVCVYVDCSYLSAGMIKKWIEGVLPEKKTIADDACDRLIQFCSFDMMRINNEIKKLAYTDGGKISKEDITRLVVPDAQYQLYELANKISARDADAALRILKTLLIDEDATGLLGGLYKHFRRLFYISATLLSNLELSKLLNVKEYAVIKSREALKNFSKSRLKKNLDIIYNSEINVKTGKMKDVDAIYFTVLSLLA